MTSRHENDRKYHGADNPQTMQHNMVLSLPRLWRELKEKASYILSDNGGNGKRGRYNGEVAGGSETNVGLR